MSNRSLWREDSELLARPRKIFEQKITQDNFQSHTSFAFTLRIIWLTFLRAVERINSTSYLIWEIYFALLSSCVRRIWRRYRSNAKSRLRDRRMSYEPIEPQGPRCTVPQQCAFFSPEGAGKPCLSVTTQPSSERALELRRDGLKARVRRPGLNRVANGNPRARVMSNA